jgi:hypothetical protein
MICASVYLLVFIRILLMHLAEKILPLHPTKFGGDYLVFSLKGGVGVELRFTREQIMSQDPIIAQSIALVPEYWKALTQSASAP